MAATYKSFLAAPSPSMLADDASLHYLTTTTSFRGANEIIKHLGDAKQVQRSGEDIINIIDGQSTIAVEVNTTIKFKTGGGVYLPGVDDSFLSSETMHFPVMHIVTFNAEGKISQIRQQWDQGSLLKQADIIGKTGRNWPIRDGKDQITFIQSCLTSAGPAAPAQPEAPKQNVANPRSSYQNAMGDPHTSLRLFGSREEIEAVDPSDKRAPYAGSRPKQRSPSDFITDAPQCDAETASAMASPSKGVMRALGPVRIFDGCEAADDSDEDEKPKEKLPHIRAHPTKYNHFDLAADPNGEPLPPPVPPYPETPNARHASSWSFEDFTKKIHTTPMRRMRQQDTRGGDAQPKKTNGASNGTAGNGSIPGDALGNITNFNGQARDSAADESSPYSLSSKGGASQSLENALQKMDINEKSPNGQHAASQKENYWTQQGKTQEMKGINVAGDGMGGRKGTARNFLSDEW